MCCSFSLYKALAASRKSPGFKSFFRAMLGTEPKSNPTYMTGRERFDFALLMTSFAIVCGMYVATFG